MLAALDWLSVNDRQFEIRRDRSASRTSGRGSAEIGEFPFSAGRRKMPTVSVSPQNKSKNHSTTSLAMHGLICCARTLWQWADWRERMNDRLEIPTTTHLRDIIKLSAATVADLNRNQRLIAVSQATRAFHIAPRRQRRASDYRSKRR